MNLQFHFTESKPSSKPRSRIYCRRATTKAKTRLVIKSLRNMEFISVQQADVLLSLLGAE